MIKLDFKIDSIRKYALIEFAIWFLIMCIAIGGFRLYRHTHYKGQQSYQIFMQDIDGLIVGSPIKFMGVQIGYIDKIKPVSDVIYVRLHITDKTIALPQGAIATVEFSGLGGSKSLELFPPTQQSAASGRIVYVERTKRLHDAATLLGDMYDKIDSIITRASHFGEESGVLTAGAQNNIEVKKVSSQLKLFEKWLDNTKRSRKNESRKDTNN